MELTGSENESPGTTLQDSDPFHKNMATHLKDFGQRGTTFLVYYATHPKLAEPVRIVITVMVSIPVAVTVCC